MTEKLPGVKRRHATAFVLAGAALLGPLTACEGGDSLPPDQTDSASGECTSKLAIHCLLYTSDAADE